MINMKWIIISLKCWCTAIRMRFICMKAGYELRQYEASKWVMTNLTTMVFTDADDKAMFDKLFYYISGNNSIRKSMHVFMFFLNINCKTIVCEPKWHADWNCNKINAMVDAMTKIIFFCRFQNSNDGPSFTGGIPRSRTHLWEHVHDSLHDSIFPPIQHTRPHRSARLHPRSARYESFCEVSSDTILKVVHSIVKKKNPHWTKRLDMWGDYTSTAEHPDFTF